MASVILDLYILNLSPVTRFLSEPFGFTQLSNLLFYISTPFASHALSCIISLYFKLRFVFIVSQNMPKTSFPLCKNAIINAHMSFIHFMQCWYIAEKNRKKRRKEKRKQGNSVILQPSSFIKGRDSLRHVVYRLTPPSCSIPSMDPNPKSKSISLSISPSSASEMLMSMFVGTADGKLFTLSDSCVMGSPDAN